MLYKAHGNLLLLLPTHLWDVYRFSFTEAEVLREVKELAQGHIAGKSWSLSSASARSRPFAASKWEDKTEELREKRIKKHTRTFCP